MNRIFLFPKKVFGLGLSLPVSLFLKVRLFSSPKSHHSLFIL